MAGQDPIHLDHNATTPLAPEVAAAMWPYLTEHFGNPSSASPSGRRAAAAVAAAREQVAAVIGAHADEIVFTSGGTESNNLAIRGVAAVASTHRALTSGVEHPATSRRWRTCRSRGGASTSCPWTTRAACGSTSSLSRRSASGR